MFVPEPDFSVYNSKKVFRLDNITQTKYGAGTAAMPQWFIAFANGGNKAVEQINSYADKYVFIVSSEGDNFTALNKWSENFRAERDLAVYAAARIEERMISSAVLFPDDEYGQFFEILVKMAYNAEYSGAAIEETYWIKKNISDEPESIRFTSVSGEVYYFFILITINKNTMQTIIKKMIDQANTSTQARGSQRISVNRLQQSFFEGF